MDDLLSSFRSANERITALYQTEDYRIQCDRFEAECKRFTQIGLDFLKNAKKRTASCKKSVLRQEYASGCNNLPRGFYSPSLILPHMLYGAKRGKILSRITSRSNPCFAYGFNSENQLVLSQSLDHGKVQRTEYLFHEQDRILGFTYNASGELESISEEVYNQGQPVRYVYASFFCWMEQPECYELSCEEYVFDAQGNITGYWHNFMIPPPAEPYSFESTLGIDPITVPVYFREVYTLPASSV